jgi:hypothetical protein
VSPCGTEMAVVLERRGLERLDTQTPARFDERTCLRLNIVLRRLHNNDEPPGVSKYFSKT